MIGKHVLGVGTAALLAIAVLAVPAAAQSNAQADLNRPGKQFDPQGDADESRLGR